MPWNHVFLFGIWLLWKDRNLCIFKNKNPNPNLAKEIVKCASEYFFCVNNPKRKILKSIRWEKQRIGWLTLNTDGSAASSSRSVGGRRLIRDEKGDWVTGFARRIGNSTSFMADSWALRDGRQLCLQIHSQAIFFELDAKAIGDAFNSQTYSNTIVSSIMDDCRHMATRIP